MCGGGRCVQGVRGSFCSFWSLSFLVLQETSRLILYISCLSPKVSHFSQELWLLFLENGVRNQKVKMCSLFGVLFVLDPLRWQSKEIYMYIYVYTNFCIYTCRKLFLYVPFVSVLSWMYCCLKLLLPYSSFWRPLLAYLLIHTSKSENLIPAPIISQLFNCSISVYEYGSNRIFNPSIQRLSVVSFAFSLTGSTYFQNYLSQYPFYSLPFTEIVSLICS